MTARERLQSAKRIVVKVGTSTITHNTGGLNLARIEEIVRELVDISNQGKEIILVTSGAIAAGMNRLRISKRPASIVARQALAAIGQGVLLHIYEKFFSEYGRYMAQILLTKENMARRHQYMNSRNALLEILKMGVIPVINENDAVAVDEIKIGDNDNLSALVATLVDADALIILSDIEGLYTANPRLDSKATLINEIAEITPAIEALAGGAGSDIGTGGMITKIEAAKIATNSGVIMAIASGKDSGNIRDLLNGSEIGTVFVAKELHLRSRKSWLAFGQRLAGEIVVDNGCEQAIKKGSSILATGIVDVYGEFLTGSTVRVLNVNNQEIARGITNYDANTVDRLRGHNTKEFAGIINKTDDKIHEEIIHRDNMVLMI